MRADLRGARGPAQARAGPGGAQTSAPCLQAPEPSGVLVVLDERVGRVVVDGLEILRFHQVGGHARIAVQPGGHVARSEEHTSELQSPCNLVCRLLLEKKKPTRVAPSTHLIVALHLSVDMYSPLLPIPATSPGAEC